MLPTPSKFSLVAGKAEGSTELTAFDKALLVAGIGNMNLVRVSSILPPSIQFVDALDIKPGSLLPIAYASYSSSVPGMVISAAVGVGISRGGYGVIMEFAGETSGEEAKRRVEAMVREAFSVRDLGVDELLVKYVEHVVDKVGCVFAGVPMFY